jgi:hypothetical protein
MHVVIKEKFVKFIETFGMAWTACIVAMTQGDLSVVSVKHFIDASQTGALTGLAMVLASFLPWDNKWIGIFLVGVFTAVADTLAHMAMFPYEAICTGFGAMLLAIGYEKLFKEVNVNERENNG